MLISSNGTLIRTPVDDISIQGRNTQGVRIINLKKNDRVGGIAKISQFSRCCNDDGIPIVWLHDISGFDIGPEAEKQGLLGYGSSLI